MKTKIPTVSIAVSVFNEENNISNFLNSVLKQTVKGYKLKEIIIISDGSTDKTIKNVGRFKNKKIKLITDINRIGKSSRLNQIYSMVNSDILIQSDADVVFSGKNVILSMIQPLIHESKVGMCGGNPTPIKAETFTEHAVNSTFAVYSKLRKEIRGGNNIFSADGRLLAYKKELYKKINVPHNMIANDAYTYFVCLTNGFAYKYVPSAIVTFRSPQSLRDHLKQNTRFVSAPIRMEKIFDKKIVAKEYFIPNTLKYTYMFEEFIKNPVGCLYIFLVNIFCKLKAIKVEHTLHAKWAMAISTKKI